MATIKNEITINASTEKVWSVLADVELLERYDPTVRKSSRLSANRTGIGAKRKVDMLDGKNWFEEKISAFEPNRVLAYDLTACSFPIKSLRHSYSFEKVGDQTRVKQVMEYTVKFGVIGRLLDELILRRQFNLGIRKFLEGLRSYTEVSD